MRTLHFSYTIERMNTMREVIQSLNKAKLALATGVSYSRLRKYASGIIQELTVDERSKIREYLLSLAHKFE